MLLLRTQTQHRRAMSFYEREYTNFERLKEVFVQWTQATFEMRLLQTFTCKHTLLG